MAKLPWLKLWNEFAIDPKVQSMSESMQRRLVMLFCLTSSGDLATLSDDELAHTLRVKIAELQKTKQLFLQKGFIDESWKLLKWEKRQSPDDVTAAERMRRYRERLREQERNVTANVTDELREHSANNVT